MSTRSFIAMRQPNDNLKAIYAHSDGYASSVAHLIAKALNERAGWHGLSIEPIRDVFALDHPGPFGIFVCRCEYRGECVDVWCQGSNQTVVYCFNTGIRGESKRIAKQIASALNTLLASSKRCANADAMALQRAGE